MNLGNVPNNYLSFLILLEIQRQFRNIYRLTMKMKMKIKKKMDKEKMMSLTLLPSKWYQISQYKYLIFTQMGIQK